MQPTSPLHRTSALMVCFVTGLLVTECVNAQSTAYPTKPIRLLVGFSPGGGTDITARIVSAKLSERIGQSIIVDNRPGVGGVLARNIAAEANPDGYTLFMLSGSQVIGASLIHNAPVDMDKTFAAIARLTSQPYLLSTNPSFPAKAVKEMIAYAKGKPGVINYGSTGMGSMAHLATELLMEMAGIKMVHVPYKGTGPGLLDLMRGQLQFLFASSTSTMPHVKASRLRLLGSSSGKRSKVLPDVPTIAESGLPGFDVTGWYAVIAPGGTPKAIITKLNREIGEVLKSPEIQKSMAAGGADAVHSTPQELTALIHYEETRWAKLIKSAGIKLK
ncbi:MAG: hypothetical protein A3G24_21430 [Betaproteobacteria bacterium RIFCSPLOWO2_12_FULL_62_13]|nr:MAG: hypothetical protein A3G24_21430 [Betaproteobacteria bacterium RIFCSPLOWO2_12_FULL_62_13]